jgi:hypothetical protein
VRDRDAEDTQVDALRSSMRFGLKYGEVGLALLAARAGKRDLALAYMSNGAQFFQLPQSAKTVFAQGLYGTPAQRSAALAMLQSHLATRPEKLEGGVPGALLNLGEAKLALQLATAQQTTNDSLVFNWIWSPVGAKARALPEFADFLKATGHLELWAHFGPPKQCKLIEKRWRCGFSP